MAKSVNKVILLGRIGKDPDLKYASGGVAFCRFSIATSDQWSDNEGNRQEKTEWHNCVAWNRIAEIVDQYVTKGAMLYVEGSLTTREWDDQQGNKRRTTEIRVREVTLLGDKNSGGSRREPAADNVPESFGDQTSNDPISDEKIPF